MNSFLNKHRVFIIAEAGVNHNGDLSAAIQLVDASLAAGADAIKFQTFQPDLLVSRNTELADYQKGSAGGSANQLELLNQLALSYDDFRKIKQYCDSNGQVFVSTPFDVPSLEFLLELDIPFIKVSSSDLTNIPFLRKIGASSKPVVLSTGMGTLAETREAVSALRESGCSEIALLHCTSQYPAPPEAVNLKAMDTLRKEFGFPIGLSDHTKGYVADIAAAAMGAEIIEKHFTLDNSLPGPDHMASLNPKDFTAMVSAIRQFELMRGNGIKQPAPGEQELMIKSRRGLAAAKDLPQGHVLEEDDITIKRPALGLGPNMLDSIIGKKLARVLRADEPIKKEDLAQ